MKKVVITLVGIDQPGLVDKVSALVLGANGNWLASNLSKMAGQFAGIIQVALPPASIPGIEQKLSQIDDLHCVLKVDEQETTQEVGSYLTIDVMGNDRPGIVQEITASLAKSNTSVVKMQTSCEAAPNWGGELFKAHIIAATDKEVDVEHITEQLEAIANDLVVELNVEHL